MMEKDQSLLWTEDHLDLAEVGDRRAIVSEGDWRNSWDKKLVGNLR